VLYSKKYVNQLVSGKKRCEETIDRLV
jgi:hypothetical protein